MVTCPPNVLPGQKIRFQLPIVLNDKELSAIQVSYDKDGWMRCLNQDMKFNWVYQSSSLKENGTLKNERIEGHHSTTDFDVDRTAFVRCLVPLNGNEKHSNGSFPTSSSSSSQQQQFELIYVPPEEYTIASTVKGTSINYQEISMVSRLPFAQKVDWLKNQFTALRTPWEEGHMKIRVRREHLLEDAVDAFLALDDEDMMKMFRYEFIGTPFIAS